MEFLGFRTFEHSVLGSAIKNDETIFDHFNLLFLQICVISYLIEHGESHLRFLGKAVVVKGRAPKLNQVVSVPIIAVIFFQESCLKYRRLRITVSIRTNSWHLDITTPQS